MIAGKIFLFHSPAVTHRVTLAFCKTADTLIEKQKAATNVFFKLSCWEEAPAHYKTSVKIFYPWVQMVFPEQLQEE